MSYYDLFFNKPFLYALSRWRTLSVSVITDLFFLITVFGVGFLYMNTVMMVGDVLDTQDLSELPTILEGATQYTSELSMFLWSLLGLTVLAVVSIALLFSVTRSFIWHTLFKVKHTKRRYVHSFVYDGVFLCGFALVMVLSSLVLQPIALAFMIVLFLVFGGLYTFHCRLLMKEKSLLRILRSFNLRSLLVLFPHSVILLGLCWFSISLFGWFGFLPAFIFLGVFRLMAFYIVVK
ncbi:MAG: hypothetical protein ACMXYE_03620 [Candidatus Woesearchaeota archaeon]